MPCQCGGPTTMIYTKPVASGPDLLTKQRLECRQCGNRHSTYERTGTSEHPRPVTSRG